MRLFIMRHGEAEQQTSIDSERNLNDRGRDEAFEAGINLSHQYNEIDFAWVSCFSRAQQTFVEVEKSVSFKQIKNSEEIIPSSRPKDVQRQLDKALLDSNYQQALIVSHMPLVSYLVDLLCENAQSMIFPTATIAEIEYDPITSLGHLVKVVVP
ncbi:phosphohistidine phosphatase SixA [Alteromonadaceae bacterium M269]|nr:phosphohistidine phosphatase SixA [Alteromonadaceae bacterium M269]